jgi:hypothetical protein
MSSILGLISGETIARSSVSNSPGTRQTLTAVLHPIGAGLKSFREGQLTIADYSRREAEEQVSSIAPIELYLDATCEASVVRATVERNAKLCQAPNSPLLSTRVSALYEAYSSASQCAAISHGMNNPAMDPRLTAQGGLDNTIEDLSGAEEGVDHGHKIAGGSRGRAA